MEVAPFAELFAAVECTAVHLEMRDAYTPDDALFRRWLANGDITDEELLDHEAEWASIARDAIGRGVVIRRTRVVSEPLADFTSFEYRCAGPLNVAAGELVRWLPRRHASDLTLPGNDCWVLDDRLVIFGHFAGDGTLLGNELVEEPAVVKMCAAAFEAAWERAIPHDQYRPAEP